MISLNISKNKKITPNLKETSLKKSKLYKGSSNLKKDNRFVLKLKMIKNGIFKIFKNSNITPQNKIIINKLRSNIWRSQVKTFQKTDWY